MSVVTTGKSVEEALRLALIQLDAGKDDVQYEVLEEGTKGFLGIGSKEFKLKVEKKPENTSMEDFAVIFVKDLLNKMDIECKVSSHEENGEIALDIEGEDIGVIIGKHGITLDSIQYITNIVVNKKFDKYVRIRLDVGGYREKRMEALEIMASRLASRVRKTRKAVALEPMNAYERRLIHTFIQKENGVSTKSEGNDPDRYVVIYAERNSYRKKGKHHKNKVNQTNE